MRAHLPRHGVCCEVLINAEACGPSTTARGGVRVRGCGSGAPASGGVAEARATFVEMSSHQHAWRCQAHAGAADFVAMCAGPGDGRRVVRGTGASQQRSSAHQPNENRGPTIYRLAQLRGLYQRVELLEDGGVGVEGWL
jgi:hypothetical protein